MGYSVSLVDGHIDVPKDEDVIKALECCLTNKCDECDIYKECHNENGKGRVQVVLDLINRQKAEIERLEAECNDKERVYTDEYCLRKEWQSKCRELLQTKSEAIKEFAERLKNIICDNIERSLDNPNGKDYYITDVYMDIINLVKEMTE